MNEQSKARETVDLSSFLHSPHTVVALDYGTKKTGVAIGNTALYTSESLPLLVMKEGIPNQAALESILRTWQPQLILVGLPLNMDDSENDLCLRAAKFARRIHANTLIPVYMLDERLTSREARSHARELLEHKAKRSPKQHVTIDPIDSVAASILLEQFFNFPQGIRA